MRGRWCFPKVYLTAWNLMIRQHTLRLLALAGSTVANASDYFTTSFLSTLLSNWSFQLSGRVPHYFQSPTDLSAGPLEHRRAWIHADTLLFFFFEKIRRWPGKLETLKWVSFSSVKSRLSFDHWTVQLSSTQFTWNFHWTGPPCLSRRLVTRPVFLTRISIYFSNANVKSLRERTEALLYIQNFYVSERVSVHGPGKSP